MRMGIQDFVMVFDRLDAAQLGFVTVDQLMCLHETVYFVPVSRDHVEAAVDQVCGPGCGGKVDRDAFMDVLQEVQRRLTLDEQAYWDFQALDFNGSHRIRLQDAMTLFQEYHGAAFSLHTWHRFLESRIDSDADVYFDEIRGWLCGIPSGEPSKDREVREELSLLEQTHWDHACRDYEAFQTLQREDGNGQDKDDYSEVTQRHTKRKLQKWQQEGLAAMLMDDGLEVEEKEGPKKMRHQDTVTASDLLDAMELKYSLLTDLLVSQLASFAANMDSERAEVTQQIKRQIAKLKRKEKLRDVDTLPGASALLPATVLYLMGELRPAHAQQETELTALRERLMAKGKSSQDIEQQLRKQIADATGGTLRCGQALADLMQRKARERELILSVARHAAVDTAPWEELCRLQRQLALLGDLQQDFLSAALAVGLAERPQTYKPSWYEVDRDRSEQLARERLAARQGHAAARTTSQVPDVIELQESGIVNIRTQLIAQVELRHHLEREALIHMLQGPEGVPSRAAGQKMSADERRRLLTKLRSHHLNWKSGGSGDSGPNYKILQEAVGLYWAERQSQLEQQHHNMADPAVSAAVLADLQQKQELDFANWLRDMAGKDADGLVSMLKRECRVRYQEHFDNIAFVVLGVVELSKEDQEYMDALSEKYRAMRDQVFVFSLREKLGHSAWKNLGREGRQAELQRMRKEEKKMRGDGRFAEMASLIGPKSQALPTLLTLIGENKVYGKAIADSTFKSQNLLADLSPRSDLEQDMLLSWLHNEEAKDSEGLRRRLQELVCLELEKFLMGIDGDFEAGFLAVGLLERIHTVASGRSKGDKEKQRQLATKRISLRKLRLRHDDPYKSPAEDKKLPSPGDKLSWQCAWLRSVLRRQSGERELLLRLLQDSGFGDLVEAASLMVAEERWQRLAQLADKHQILNLASRDGYEEHLSILEEAAALRVVGVRALARRQAGRALSEDEVSASLLTELQDLHDTELAQWLQDMIDMDEPELQKKIDGEKQSRDREQASAVMAVLTRVDGDSELTDAFVKLVEKKYAVLGEALYCAVVDHHGGPRLSQKQRDKQLQALRKEITTFWNTGDAEGVAKVLVSEPQLDRPLAWLIGMEHSKFTKERDAAEPRQKIKESTVSDGTGMLATVKHLLQRFSEEKDYILACLAGAQGVVLSNNMKAVLKSRLKWETTLTSAESNLTMAAIVCGLAERGSENTQIAELEHDGERYRLQAEHECRLRQSGREGRPKKDGLSVDRSENRETLQDSVLALLHKKHLEERQLLVEMLVTSRFEEAQRAARLESSQQNADRLAALRAKRLASNLESSAENLAVLQEALTVLREVMRAQQGRGASPEDDHHLHCEMMAGLLWLQNSEAAQHLGDFVSEELSEMVERQEQIIEEIRRNHCTNIAALVFFDSPLGPGGTDVDPVVDALDGKYDALRDKLLIQALIDQMGENDWRLLSERERMKRLLELKLKERQLRREGKYDELALLLGEARNNEATLRKLLGENREEQERKLKERLAKRRQRLAEGLSEEECDQLEAEEDAQEEEEARQRQRNVLEDLEHNYQQERDELLRQLREGGGDTERERQKKMLQLRLEQRRLRREDDVFSTALLLQQHDQREKDRQTDRKRQEQLARERLEAALERRKKGLGPKDDGQPSVTASDADAEHDVSRLQEMALTSLDLKHQAEREALVKLFDEHSEGDYREKGRKMSMADLVTRLDEIQELIQQSRSCNGLLGFFNSADLQLLKEALAYSLEIKRLELEMLGKSPSESDLQVALLADLQEIQDTEAGDIMTAVSDMDAQTLRQLTHTIIKNKEQGRHDNVVKVLLHQGKEEAMDLDGQEGDEAGLSEEEKEERRVVKALEMKYDALRDKMIIEALIQQHGEAEWRRMSELERQRELLEMRRKERQLRREGKMDELEALLGQHLKHKQNLDTVLGQSQQEQKRRLEERLARRRQLKEEREAAGLTADDATLDSIQEQEEEEEEEKGKNKRRNVLEQLEMHFEDEKAALLARLHQGADAHERERERQRNLVRLQREAQRLKGEEKVDSAALIFSLGQQAAADHEDSLMKERERQRQLARERLMQRRRQILDGKDGGTGDQQSHDTSDEDIALDSILSDGASRLQEGALMALDKHQAAERDTLMELLAQCRRDQEAAKRLKGMTPEELRLKLTRGEKDHVSWRKESAKKVAALSDPRLTTRRREKLIQKSIQRRHAQQDILRQALGAKLELERRDLEKLRTDAKEEEIWEELCICALSDLQERQMMQLNTTQEAIFSKSKEELVQLRNTQRAAGREGWFDSLGAVVFTVGDMAAETMSLTDRRSTVAQVEAEFQRQKMDIMEKAGVSGRNVSAQRENLDADALLRQLESQHEAKKQAMLQDMERQRNDVKQRLQARRRRQADHDSEAETALLMLRQAESHSQAAQDRADSARGHQRSLLQERLQQRREARKRAAEDHRLQELQSNYTASPMPSDLGRSDSVSSVGGLRREKTRIDASVSEDQKQAIYERLMRQNLKKQSTVTAERQRQEEALKRKREARIGKREDEAAAVFSLGERQKTSLEIAKKGEKERQIAEMRERLSRVKYERTMTKKGVSSLASKGYSDMALEEGDEKMEEKARELEDKLKQQAAKTEQKEEANTDADAQPLTDEKSRMDILKQRRKQKKQQRQDQ